MPDFYAEGPGSKLGSRKTDFFQDRQHTVCGSSVALGLFVINGVNEYNNNKAEQYHMNMKNFVIITIFNKSEPTYVNLLY